MFKPVAIEAGFGPGEELPSLEIPLRRGDLMKLRGRIDRVDATEIGGKNYVRVVDYKSSAKSLDLTEVYYGLSLQMMTYLARCTRKCRRMAWHTCGSSGCFIYAYP